MSRLPPDQQAIYLCDIMPLLEKISELSVIEARRLFFQSAKSWMSSSEIKSFTESDIAPEDSNPDYCKVCEKTTSFTLDEPAATNICDVCGWAKSFVGALSDKYLPWDFEPPSQACPYRRSNHFNEYLDSFMARQSSTLPDDLFENIHKELKKLRITDYTTLTQKRIRTIMKDLKLNKHYESAPFILYKIKGEKPPELTRAIEEELKSNFDLIQEPFERVVKLIAPERKNFLSYSYTIYKMLQLMELDHLLEYFTLLKSREKLLLQDKIWSGICKELNWRFIPSV
tara:strand:- start:3101 stop:3955 length:855 start_codon:yes stop_codon:yes gene_type:complete